METRIPRRKFLRGAAAVAATGGALALGDPRAPGAAAPDATASTRLLSGCCAYSFRKYLDDGRMSMEDFIRKGAELGVNGVDLTAYWLKSTDPAYLTSLRQLAFKNGVPFSGVAIGASMVQAEAAKRAQVLEDIQKWVDATDRLGASHLRVFAGELPPGASVEQGTQWTVETMKRACDYSGKKGITLGIEDHGGISQKASVCLDIMRRIDSPFAGINLDISNFAASSDEEQYAQIEACVPYATHTHIRDTFSETQRPIDLDRVWQIFARGGYRGYMSAEYEGEEDAMTGVPKLIEKIKALCKKYSSV